MAPDKKCQFECQLTLLKSGGKVLTFYGITMLTQVQILLVGENEAFKSQQTVCGDERCWDTGEHCTAVPLCTRVPYSKPSPQPVACLLSYVSLTVEFLEM